MIETPRKIKQAILGLALSLTLCIDASLASLTVNLTGGMVEATQSFDNLITLRGKDNDGRNIVLTAESGFGPNPLAFNPYDPGDTVSPNFYSGGGDLVNFILSINGVDVPVNGIGGPLGRPGSEIEVNGTSILLPSTSLTESAKTPVTYNAIFNLYNLGNRTFGSAPDYILTGTGLGTAELFYEAFPNSSGAPAFYLVSPVKYSLNPTNSSVPEPSSLVICLLLAAGISRLNSR